MNRNMRNYDVAISYAYATYYVDNGYTCPAIYINLDTFVCRLVAVYSFS